MKLEPPATSASSVGTNSVVSPSTISVAAVKPEEEIISTILIDDIEPTTSISNVIDRSSHMENTINSVIASVMSNQHERRNSVQYAMSAHSQLNLGAPRTVQFEDLPENFMENISPGEQAPFQQIHHSPYISSQRAMSPQPIYSSLTPVSLVETSRDTQTSVGLTPLIPMAVTPSNQPTYMLSSLKLEPHESAEVVCTQPMVPTLLQEVASSIPPTIMVDSSSGNFTNPVLVQQNGGALQYVKVEFDISNQQLITNGGQNVVRPATTAVSTVELANNLIATMLNDQPSPEYVPIEAKHGINTSTPARIVSNPAQTQNARIVQNSSSNGSERGIKRSRTDDDDDVVVGEDGEVVDDDIYIDTKELCKRVAYELKQHSIPQAIFAERVLCRSQGTLSDLLRNPKPWNKLKSGRETFRRMYNWLKQPLPQRLASLELWRDGCTTTTSTSGVTTVIQASPAIPISVSPPAPSTVRTSLGSYSGKIPAKLAAKQSLIVVDSYTPPQPAPPPPPPPPPSSQDNSRLMKRPRLVFTDIQKRTLQAIFKETQRPSREMQQTIAEHLGLDLSTVANFFMNARRRSRGGPLGSDEPAPFQNVRPITPPPTSPPHSIMPRGRRRNTAPNNVHIADTVAQVASSAVDNNEETTRIVYIDKESGELVEQKKKEQIVDVIPVERMQVNVKPPVLTYERRSLPVMSLETLVRSEKVHQISHGNNTISDNTSTSA